MKIFVENYGCSANLNNSEIMKGILAQNHEIVDNENDADAVLLNTCVVKGPTENRITRRMMNINKKLIVSGCMADTSAKKISELRPDAIIVSSHRIRDVENAVKESKSVFREGNEVKLGLPKIKSNPNIEIIQINEGCLGACTYCMTKFAKGILFSYYPENIIEQIKNSSCPEIWLTSQDCGAYGKEIKTNLPKLLKSISEIPKDFKIRVGMANPNHIVRMIPELIDAYKSEKIFKFLHIPLQAGSDKVLKDMKRGYKANEYVKIVEDFRNEFPKIHIMTDIICGYPTETKEDFEQTMKIIEKTRPDSLNISRFWPRPGTKAADLKLLPDKIVMERSKKLHEIFSIITREKNNEWTGWQGKVLADETRNSQTIARNESYKQVVLDRIVETGKEYSVKITGAGEHFLRGEIIE